MSRRAVAVVAALLLPVAASGQPAARPNKVGVTTLELHDARRARPLVTQVWYPAVPDATESEQRYDFVFLGRAAPDAPAAGARHPLVLLSHGDRGGRTNQSWLAETLAANGYVVAAVDHWNNTRERNTPEGTLRVWERPQDLSFVATALLGHPAWQARVDPARLGAAGWSSGGYAALALAGARYSPVDMGAYCLGPDAGPDCALGRGADVAGIDFRPALQSWRDDRFRAAFAMAPALGPGIVTDSLRGIRVPVEIVAARDDELLPFARHAARYAADIPGARLLALPAGGHFVFMPTCSTLGSLLLWFHRFDVCGRRHGDVDRAAVHATVGAAAVRFFDRVLKP